MSGCTAFTTNGQDCLAHADREFTNVEGLEMRLCAKHDEAFYKSCIAAASIPEKASWGGAAHPATLEFYERLHSWTG